MTSRPKLMNEVMGNGAGNEPVVSSGLVIFLTTKPVSTYDSSQSTQCQELEKEYALPAVEAKRKLNK